MHQLEGIFRNSKSLDTQAPDPSQQAADQERRTNFLKYVNRGWLILGIVTLASLPFFPNNRAEFIWMTEVTFPTSLLVGFLNTYGRSRLAGLLFTLIVNLGLYGLFIVLVRELGPDQAFETQATVWMLMGLAVLFAGALIDKWAAPVTAFFNTILLLATRLTLAPGSDPRPSLLVFWGMLALTIWLYEATLNRAQVRVWTELAERRKAEEILTESEERFRGLSQASFEGIMIHDDGVILKANQAFAELFGYRDPDELIGKHGLDTMHFVPESRELLKARMASEVSERFEIMVVRPDGSVFPAETQGKDITFSGRKLRVVAMRDITERKRSEEQLKQTTARLDAIVTSSPVGIVSYDLEGRVITWNQAAERIFGWKKEEVLGRFAPHIPPSMQPEFRDLHRRVLTGETIMNMELRRQKKDSTPIDISLYAAPMYGLTGTIDGHMALIQDITESKRTQSELKRYAKNNAVLYELSQKILISSDTGKIFDDIHQAVQKLMPCDAFVIALLDVADQEIEDVYLWDHDRRWPGERHATGHGLTGFVISTGKPLLVNDWDESHSRLTGSGDFGYSEQDTQSVLAVPLFQTGGRCFGMMSVQAYSSNAYTEEDQQLLMTLTNPVSRAIENAQLLKNLRSSNLELSQAYDATIEGWSRAMDLRDKETEGHTQRVTTLALKLAHRMEFSEVERTQMRRGALLHDIGKIGVPDRILFKVNRLTKKEWEIMRQHPVYGYNLLSGIEFLRSAIDIPYCHHEKWDGTGYPRGLVGEQIPLVARIFAIVDVWDALTNARPYRSAWSKELSIKYINEQSGKHFDPQVVKAFLSLVANRLMD